MAQKRRAAKQIPDGEFDKLTETIIRENKELLERLAKV
jgi:hypothetical protein